MHQDGFLRALVAARVSHVVGLPDTDTSALFARRGEGSPRFLTVAREGEALGVAAGLWAGGARPLILIQSTGFFESGDALRNFLFELEVPLVLVVGYRGFRGKLNAGSPDTARQFIEPALRAFGLAYRLLVDDEYGELVDAFAESDGGLSRPMPRVFLLPE